MPDRVPTDMDAPASPMPPAGEAVLLDVVGFCAVECALQVSGEESVAWMVNAWKWAELISPPLVHDDIRAIGALVEPDKNRDGYRQVNVRVGSNVKPPWGEVPSMMTDFLNGPPLDPAEWFYQYEMIHPFRDGNGRSGVIFYNLLRGTLDRPDWAPDFWNDRRRTPGFGAPRVGGLPRGEEGADDG